MNQKYDYPNRNMGKGLHRQVIKNQMAINETPSFAKDQTFYDCF